MKGAGIALLAFAAALGAMGLYMMERQAASAAKGGGLLGGLGEMTIGVAIVAAVIGAALVYAGTGK